MGDTKCHETTQQTICLSFSLIFTTQGLQSTSIYYIASNLTSLMESTSEAFLSPILSGARFDDHTLPLSLLEDFSALEELIIEVAKQVYLDENPLRQRVPRGFTDNVSLKLSRIDEGSSIPRILLAFSVGALTALSDSFADSSYYFEKAKDKVVEAINNANQNKSINLDPKYLNYFNRVGKNLLEDESIDFSFGSNSKAVLNKDIRRKILLSRDDKYEYSEVISFNASVPSVDKGDETFKLDIDGNVIECKLDPSSDFHKAILSAFTEYENNALVSVKATGIYNRQNKLIRIEGIESMDVLDPYDVNVRLSYLSKLEDEWYDGVGKAPNSNSLDVFGQYFGAYYDRDLALPSIFPTIEGNIQLEWNSSISNIFLEVFLNSFSAEFVISNSDDTVEEFSLNLNEVSDWKIINKKIKSLINE